MPAFFFSSLVNERVSCSDNSENDDDVVVGVPGGGVVVGVPEGGVGVPGDRVGVVIVGNIHNIHNIQSIF